MTFYEALDSIMKQDFGGRGLLTSLPPSALDETVSALVKARRVILLTGFPVRMPDGSFVGETDGPSGTANLAAALTKLGCSVSVVTDCVSYPLLKEALYYRAPFASLTMIPSHLPQEFIRGFVQDVNPTHFISLERPGMAQDGHYYNMRGEIIDDMVTDTSLFLSESKKIGAITISIGDGGNEMGMGTFRCQIERSVPKGSLICTKECADITLASGVSNWWGWGLTALLSVRTGYSLLPSESTETELLRRVVKAGGVDGCTKERTLTVDNLPLSVHLAILCSVTRLTGEYIQTGTSRTESSHLRKQNKERYAAAGM